MRRWKIKNDSDNADYWREEWQGKGARLLKIGMGTPKFLLYKAKDYNQIIGIRWELTDTFDPQKSSHLARAQADIDVNEPVIKLWNQVIYDNAHGNTSMKDYLLSLSNEQIDDIFNDSLSEPSHYSYANINTPIQFLTYQNSNNSERVLFLFDGRTFYNSINKQVIE